MWPNSATLHFRPLAYKAVGIGWALLLGYYRVMETAILAILTRHRTRRPSQYPPRIKYHAFAVERAGKIVEAQVESFGERK